MAIIKTLKDFFTGQKIYPKTFTKAIYSDDGERLDIILKNTVAYDVEQEIPDASGDLPRDADTLGGKYTASDIAKLKGFAVPVTKEITLLATNWTENSEAGRYEYRIEDVEFTNIDDFVEIVAPSTLSGDQINELMGACCYNGETGVGYVILYCWGSVPTLDIPVLVVVSHVTDESESTE